MDWDYLDSELGGEILSFPFDAELVEIEPGVFEHDRKWDAKDFSVERAMFIGNGIFFARPNCLKVISKYNTLTLTLSKGSAWIFGRSFTTGADIDFSVNPPTAQPRVDMVVIELNKIERVMKYLYVPGTTEVVRNSDRYQLKLAEITVQPQATAIYPQNILDTRLNSEVCGIVSSMFDQPDTTDIFNQYMAALDEFMVYQDGRIADFDVQFEEFKNLLAALETQSFTLINNNFDDWSVKRGCRYDTVFLPDGNISETITVIAIGFTLAERLTEFLPNGNIVTTITFNAWETTEGGNVVLTTSVTIAKTTVFNDDGSITEVTE